MEESARRRVKKRLLTRQARIVERVIDELTYHNLKNIEEVVNEVVALVKSEYIVIKKTDDGFKYSVKDVNNKEKDKETEPI